MSNFGSVIKTLREDRDLTQRGLAKRAELGADTIYRIEKMASPKINAATFRALANGLGLSVDALNERLRAVATTGIPYPTYTPDFLRGFMERHKLNLPDVSSGTGIRYQRIEDIFCGGDATTWELNRIDEWVRLVDGGNSQIVKSNFPSSMLSKSLSPVRDRSRGIPFVAKIPSGGLTADFSADTEYLPLVLFDFPDVRPVAMKVDGDSMAPRIMPGDIVICATQNYEPQNGDILAVGLNNSRGHMLGKLKIVDSSSWEIQPANHFRYEPVMIKTDEILWHVLVVGIFSNLWNSRTSSIIPAS